MRKITEWRYSDDRVVVCRCSTHRDKWMIVLRRHTSIPTHEEEEYMRKIMDDLFPGMRLRGPASILDHYHLHEV